MVEPDQCGTLINFLDQIAKIYPRDLGSSPWTALYQASYHEPRINVMGIDQTVCFM
jgi:hypothetical protein